MLLAMLTISQTALGVCQDQLNACNKVIDLGNQALVAKDKEIDLAKISISQQTEHAAQLQVKLTEAEESNGSWYHNPFIMLALGLVTGVALTQFRK